MMLKPLEPFRRPLTGQAVENSHAMDTYPPVNTRQYDEKDKDKAKMEFTFSLSVDVTETRRHNYVK